MNGRPEVRASYRGRAALVTFALALVLQSLAPPGYMAGSLDDGWPVVLCPEGLPAGFLGHAHHHHEHGGDNARQEHTRPAHSPAHSPDRGLDGHCPLGGMLDASATSVAANLPAVTTGAAGIELLTYRAPVLQRPTTLRVPRGPPIPA